MTVKELTDRELLDKLTEYGTGINLTNGLQEEAERRGLAHCDNHPDLYAESNQIMDSRFGRVAYCKTCIRTEAAHI